MRPDGWCTTPVGSTMGVPFGAGVSPSAATASSSERRGGLRLDSFDTLDVRRLDDVRRLEHRAGGRFQD